MKLLFYWRLLLTASFVVMLFLSCRSGKNAPDAKLAKIKADHAAQNELLRSTPDPYYKYVADSLKEWLPILKTAFADDQKYRIVGYNLNKEERALQAKLDSANVIIAESYLDKYGWPSLKEIGLLGQRSIGIIIQHSPLKIQEKYYPLLVQTYKRAPAGLTEILILMEDRINLRNRRFQYYGSQAVSYKGKMVLYPVSNIDSIDVYRKRAGIAMPVAEYLKRLNVQFDINEYKQLLPELIKEFKVSDTAGVHYDMPVR